MWPPVEDELHPGLMTSLLQEVLGVPETYERSWVCTSTSNKEVERKLGLLSCSRLIAIEREKHKRMLCRLKNLLLDYQASSL